MLKEMPLSPRVYANFFVQTHGTSEALNIARDRCSLLGREAPRRDRDLWLQIIEEIKKLQKAPPTAPPQAA